MLHASNSRTFMVNLSPQKIHISSIQRVWRSGEAATFEIIRGSLFPLRSNLFGLELIYVPTRWTWWRHFWYREKARSSSWWTENGLMGGRWQMNVKTRLMAGDEMEHFQSASSPSLHDRDQNLNWDLARGKIINLFALHFNRSPNLHLDLHKSLPSVSKPHDLNRFTLADIQEKTCTTNFHFHFLRLTQDALIDLICAAIRSGQMLRDV